LASAINFSSNASVGSRIVTFDQLRLVFFNGALIEISVGVDGPVEQIFLGGVNFLNTGQAALFF